MRSTVKDLKPKDLIIIEKGDDERDEEIAGAKIMTEWEATHAAAESGNLTELRRFILQRGVHVDAEDRYSMTLLQVASRKGHLDTNHFLRGGMCRECRRAQTRARRLLSSKAKRLACIPLSWVL
ncbi:hypothetical protein BDR22DRAFT_252008 [Usnea florida]